MPPDASDLKNTSLAWYHPTLTTIDPQTRSLLEERGVPSDEVLNHVQTIRDKAWAIYPYPCIGMFSFTRLHLITHPLYKTSILPTLLSGGTLLDLGAGFASDFRALVSAGVSSSQFTAVDEHDGFWKLGKELYRDQESMRASFVKADMTDLGSFPDDLLGKFDIVWAGASFHLFGWQGQVKAGVVAVRLLKDKIGTAVYGYQMGRTTGREVNRAGEEVLVGGMYLHDGKTFEKMWEEIGAQVGMKFEVKCWMDDRGLEDLKMRDQEIRRVRFAVVRLDTSEGRETKTLT